MANKKRKLEEKEDVVMEEEASSSSEVERLEKNAQYSSSSSDSESESEQEQQQESEHEKEEEEEEEESEEEKEKSESEEEEEEMEVDGDDEEEEEENEEVEKVEETSSSSESEEEATPVVPSKEQSSDSSDSEEEKDGEEEEVMQKQEENSDSSSSEEEEEIAPVVQSKELSSDSEEEEEEGEEASPVVQKLEESSDSSDAEEKEEENEKKPKEKPVEKRKPVKVSIPTLEGPPKKKAKIEKIDGSKEDTRMEALRRILEPLQREVLLATMLNVAAKYDEVYADLKSSAGILKVAANLNVKKAADNRAPGRTLFVRSLSQKTTADTLRNAYEKFGDVVTAHVPWNHTTNESKCYGFVTFREKAGAHNALKTPTIKIDDNYAEHNLAREGKAYTDSRTVSVQNLSKAKTTEETLRALFGQFGKVASTHVIRDKETNESKGFGIVNFREKAGALNALAAPQVKLHGNILKCSLKH
ncbi:hypothetical protein PR001_g1949 [Phytophthora rubi]|uniref:RRM domain-containing protein n=1 Tax=Phytophthora rubi TaxID=129364 RepID=A0A6A3NF38_9STRA|nr:hypothetical protein PR002_g4165 [Phytophthora rubi]KAE9050906.1 hypothetical protein PR001_g1949 [Phytophthora rubi]